MSQRETRYVFNDDVKFPQSTKFDVADVIEATVEPWFNQALVEVNDSIVRLGVLQGEFHWHKHDAEDELFFVLAGELLLDIGEQTHRLSAGQGFVVPKGELHRTRAPSQAQVLVMATNGVTLTGD